MASGRHYCTDCRSWYRTWALHASSQKHRETLRRRATPSTSRKGIRGGFKPRRVRNRAHDDALMVKVDDYFRNPPTPPWPASVTARVHFVNDHWRRAPYRAIRILRSRRRGR